MAQDRDQRPSMDDESRKGTSEENIKGSAEPDNDEFEDMDESGEDLDAEEDVES